jgi:hypothetical protein
MNAATESLEEISKKVLGRTYNAYFLSNVSNLYIRTARTTN